jgi:hypothetical protein
MWSSLADGLNTSAARQPPRPRPTVGDARGATAHCPNQPVRLVFWHSIRETGHGPAHSPSHSFILPATRGVAAGLKHLRLRAPGLTTGAGRPLAEWPRSKLHAPDPLQVAPVSQPRLMRIVEIAGEPARRKCQYDHAYSRCNHHCTLPPWVRCGHNKINAKGRADGHPRFFWLAWLMLFASLSAMMTPNSPSCARGTPAPTGGEKLPSGLESGHIYRFAEAGVAL